MAHLDGLGLFHMELGLARVDKALAALGLTRPPYKVAHVVGTNGKGSTSRYLSEICMAHGLRTGLYTSPHMISPRERVLVDGHMLDEASWTALANEVLAASTEAPLTYFEFITVLAVLAFARAGVRVAVMEAGLGGRYDATTALETDLTIFTPVGLDHTLVLGSTLTAIARDKAGAMRGGVLAVTARQHPEARAVLMDMAARQRTPLLEEGDVLGPACPLLTPGMAGPHQLANTRLALAAWKLLTRSVQTPPDVEACVRAVAGARLPGRFQRIEGDPELILDGAHNPHALDALARTLKSENVRPACVVFGCMADKDLATMGPQVLALTEGPVIAVGLPDMERAAKPEALAEALGPRALPARDIAAGLDMARDLVRDMAPEEGGPVLVCGSLYLLGEYFQRHPEHLGYPQPDLSL